MSKFYRIKPKETTANPSHGIYVTKEERNRTILCALLVLLFSWLKYRLFKKIKG